MLRNKSFTVEIRGKLAHQSPQGTMQKLFDCIRPRFLACLTFHTKEKRLRHLHKRTNPGSSPALVKTLFSQSTPEQAATGDIWCFTRKSMTGFFPINCRSKIEILCFNKLISKTIVIIIIFAYHPILYCMLRPV